MKFLSSLALACGLILGGANAASAAPTTAAVSTQDIVQTAVSTPGFGTLTTLLTQANLVSTLQGPGPFTVFAPTDSAFSTLDPNLVTFLTDPANVESLRNVLLYHVAPGQFGSPQVLASPFLSMANGQRANVTFFGGLPRIDGCIISVTDIICSNGIIHVLDAVMSPNLARIADTAASTSRFDTLLAALGAANLAAVLDGPGPFTVLAPTDHAFAALPPGFVASLLLPQNQGLLQDILKYHVIPGRAYADQALSQGNVTTLNGNEVFFAVVNGVPRVNGARIFKRDIDCLNGVVHAIDRVLLPPLP
ncbi:MAG: fasciclin domain-containing protein [Planctomycetes bacterium]|nr:fasciclin domain-containing protein [Planctomycetota bacterium]